MVLEMKNERAGVPSSNTLDPEWQRCRHETLSTAAAAQQQQTGGRKWRVRVQRHANGMRVLPEVVVCKAARQRPSPGFAKASEERMPIISFHLRRHFRTIGDVCLTVCGWECGKEDERSDGPSRASQEADDPRSPSVRSACLVSAPTFTIFWSHEAYNGYLPLGPKLPKS
jgi:hypothetical protein